MTPPLTDQQLAAIQGRHDRSSNSGAWRTTEQADAVADRGKLLAEVTRLRAELEQARAERDRLLAFANWTVRNSRPLTEVHTAALTAIDSPSTRAALVDLAQVAAEVAAGESAGHQPHCVAATQGCCSCEEPTTPSEPARPSPDHQAVYVDQHNQSVWCDYLTMPPGDDVVPLVYANEVAESKADLAARGIELRVIGWVE